MLDTERSFILFTTESNLSNSVLVVILVPHKKLGEVVPGSHFCFSLGGEIYTRVPEMASHGKTAVDGTGHYHYFDLNTPVIPVNASTC